MSGFANGFRLVDQDAFATARGGAFVATADNASAVYYNPAGLTQLEGVNFRGGVYGIYLDPTYRPPSSAANSSGALSNGGAPSTCSRPTSTAVREVDSLES